ncbi:thioredoxin, putative [Bodo saltans]|uniref:Thioredoxin, putative n=1 Tax=Bodo saltans TaxID=75058 RepID=A0A0S4JHS9_BODSA|nr:thioredoxin, putative [Bodo saltans]|eukprot:CUG89567.1 thioredoxin, putative [Bodo saltans]
MADEAQETPVVAPPKTFPVTAVATLEDFQTRIAVQERVTAVLFWAKDGGAASGQTLSTYELVSDESEFASTISFLHVDVAEAREISKAAKVFALPTTQFYFNGAVIEEFSGNNAEKVKLMAKNAVVRRTELIKEAEARAAAAAAAAAAAEEGDVVAE